MDATTAVEGWNGEVGRISYYAHLPNPPSPSLRKKKVSLTFVADEDVEMLEKQGLASLRQARMMRLCREASDQGALLAYDDLTHLLLTSMSTLKRDLRRLKKDGFQIPIYRKKQRLGQEG